MRFFTNDPVEVDVRWFFCVPDAKVFPASTLFGSGNWASDRLAWPGPGEVLEAARPWVDGSLPPFAGLPDPNFTGQNYAGPLAIFEEGATFPGVPLNASADGLCAACGVTCQFRQWTFATENGPVWAELGPATIRVDFQDSSNCGGTNAQVQTAHACRLFQFSSEQDITVTVNGKNEAENEGFDQLRVFFDGEEVLFINSTEENKQCQMVARTANYQATLSADDVHKVEIDVTTVDGQWHKGMFFEIVVRFR